MHFLGLHQRLQPSFRPHKPPNDVAHHSAAEQEHYSTAQLSGRMVSAQILEHDIRTTSDNKNAHLLLITSHVKAMGINKQSINQSNNQSTSYKQGNVEQ